MKIAIIGFGVVGSGAYEMAKRAGDIEVVRILARHGREGYEDLSTIITPNIEDITGDPEIELVIESIGGVHPAREYVLACLNAGKHVVTPNKNLVSACFGELYKAASENGVQFRCTPTAGGGIPWLYNLQRTKRCDSIKSVRGIVNGTCNYILDAMHGSGAGFDVMLAEAQRLGYAEADPSSDIEGTDSLRKTVISANLAFDTAIEEEQVPCFGIATIDASDIEWFNSHGYTCRLMMNAALSDKGSVSAYVEPTIFPATALEANVRTNNNMITLEGECIGVQSFYGQGAGMLPTGESVIQDVIDIRDGIGFGGSAAKENAGVDNGSCCHRYYIRHDRMCPVIEPLIESCEEKDGVFYCITVPMPVSRMHSIGKDRREKGMPVFFAGIAE